MVFIYIYAVKLLHKPKLLQIIVFIIALQILNISIDSSVMQNDNLAKTSIGFNYIDSYVEYIAEVILKYENAIPETGKRQHKELQQHKLLLLICSNVNILYTTNLFLLPSRNVYCNEYDNYAYRFIKEINAPPEISFNVPLYNPNNCYANHIYI